MKTPNYLIIIPEPCHENWDAMQPDATGKFCKACNKSVVDFSTKTDAQIHDLLIEYKNQKVCGHFKTTQLNRPLHINVRLSDLPRQVSATRAFAIAVFLAFGTLLFSCTTTEGKKIDEITVTSIPQDDTTFSLPTMTGEMAATTTPDSLKVTVCSKDTLPPENFRMGKIRAPQDTVTPVQDSITVEHFVAGLMVAVDQNINDTVPIVRDSSFVTPLETTSDQVMPSHKDAGLRVYPNPGAGEFTLNYTVLKPANVRIDLFDLQGSWIKTLVTVEKQYEGNYHIPVNLNELPKGVYVVNMINAGEWVTQKLVIEK